MLLPKPGTDQPCLHPSQGIGSGCTLAITFLLLYPEARWVGAWGMLMAEAAGVGQNPKSPGLFCSLLQPALSQGSSDNWGAAPHCQSVTFLQTCLAFPKVWGLWWEGQCLCGSTGEGRQ